MKQGVVGFLLMHLRTFHLGYGGRRPKAWAQPWGWALKASLILATCALLASQLGPRRNSSPEQQDINDPASAYAYTYTDPPQLTLDAMKRLTMTPPLRASGRYIFDANGTRVKLASINWYGASDEFNVTGGLDVRHRSEIAATIRRLGFNSVRLPYSDEMVMSNPLIASKRLAANPDLHGKRALDVYEAVVTALSDAGIATIVNNHNTQSTWFTGMTLCDATWHNDYLPSSFCRVRQTEEQWIEHWETVMARLVDIPLVIGADLRNEVHGFYGTVSWSSWAQACERVGERLLKMQPSWLMFVEGLSSANDVSGAKKRPVAYSVPERVVYSAHVYAWSGWGSLSPFNKRKYPSFREEMQRNWAFLLESNTAPVWVGEFGVGASAEKGDRHYWDNLMRYLAEVDADWGYWALNPRKPHGNEYESYSILGDDWKSEIRDDYRMTDLRHLMRDDNKKKGL